MGIRYLLIVIIYCFLPKFVNSVPQTQLQQLEPFSFDDQCIPDTGLPDTKLGKEEITEETTFLMNNDAKKISTDIDLQNKFKAFYKKQGFLVSNGAETFFELASWGVALAFGIAASVASLGIVGPAVGLISWVAGYYFSKKDFKSQTEDKKLIADTFKNIDNTMQSLTIQLNKRFDGMTEYIDQNTIAFEKTIMLGEFKQLHAQVSDCLNFEIGPERDRCFLYRCSEVKSSYNKFAIYSEEIEAMNRMAIMIRERDGYDSITDEFARKRISKLSARRMQTNIIMFHSFVSRLLIPCAVVEHVKIEKEGPNDKSKEAKQILFDKLDANANKWNIKKRVNEYVRGALLINEAWFFETRREFNEAGMGVSTDNVNYVLQCRYKMNGINLQTCDRALATKINDWDAQVKTELKKQKNNKVFKDEKTILEESCEEYGNDEGNWKGFEKYSGNARTKFKTFYGKIESSLNELFQLMEDGMKKSKEDIKRSLNKDLVYSSVLGRYFAVNKTSGTDEGF